MPTLQPYHGQTRDVYLWHYVPNIAAAIAFAVLFALATAVHAWKMIKTAMWFCAPFIAGGIFEVIGFIARAAAAYSTGELAPYLIQAIFLLLPPVLFAVSQYMMYSRVVRAVQGEQFSLISPRWTTVIFISGDWACLNIQGSGSGMLSNPKKVQIGNAIIIAGLGLQILVFVLFMLCCLTFNMRFRAHQTKTGAARDIPWQSPLNMLYSTSLAVLVRNIYRIAEFIMGQDSYFSENEWPTYVFDGSLMLLVMIAFLIWYPSQFGTSGGDSMIELTTDGTSSVEHDRAVMH